MVNGSMASNTELCDRTAVVIHRMTVIHPFPVLNEKKRAVVFHRRRTITADELKSLLRWSSSGQRALEDSLNNRWNGKGVFG